MNLSINQAIQKAPLLPSAVCILLASLTYYLFQFEISYLITMPLFLMLACLLLFLKKPFSFLLIFLSFIFFYCRIQIHEEGVVDLEKYKDLDRRIIQIEGIVEDIPSLDWDKSFQEKRSIAFLIKIKNSDGHASEVYQKVFVYDNTDSQILPGDHVSIIGEFRFPKKNKIPGGFNTYDYYQQNNWVGNLRVKGWDAVVIKSSDWHWRRWLFQIRKRLYQKIVAKFPQTSSGFVASIVIGYKDNLDKVQISQFQNLGIAHVFAISGLHLGLIALWTWWFGGFFIVSLRKRTVLTLLLTLLYCLISGSSLSSVRAFIMLTCFLGGYLFNKRANVWNNFSLSMLLLFLWNPAVVLTVGFQLSYLAVLGILTAHSVLTRNTESNAFDLLEPKSPWRVIRRKVFDLLFYSLMISITTGAITGYHFNIISYGSILLNLFIIPYFTFVLGLTFIFSLGTFVLPQVCFVLPDYFIQLLFRIPDWLGGQLPAYQYIQSPSKYLIVLLIIGFLWLNTFKLKLSKIVFLNVGYYLFIIALLFVWQKPSKNQLVVLDVGKAQAIHLQSEKGENFLFDCGTISGYDSITPYLKHRGVNQLDGVYVSHDNSDHFNCWKTIFRKFKIKSLYAKTSTLNQSRSFKNMLATSKSYWKKKTSIDLKVDNKAGVFTCLHPKNQKYLNKNEESVVWFASLDWCEILFPGDIQNKGVFELIQKPLSPKTKKRILIVPHHGRNVSYLDQLLLWFEPDLIIVSGDKLSAGVKKLLMNCTVPVLMTSQVGTIVIDDGMKLSEMRQYQQIRKSMD